MNTELSYEERQAIAENWSEELIAELWPKSKRLPRPHHEDLTEEEIHEADVALDNSIFHRIADYALAISKRIGVNAESTAKIIGFWTRHTPYQERGDVLQGMAESLLIQSPTTEGLTFAVCRSYVCKWWERFHVRQHIGLESPIDGDGDDTLTLADTLISECQYERIEDLDEARSIIRQIPPDIMRAVNVQLTHGHTALTRHERVMLREFARKNAMAIMGDHALTMVSEAEIEQEAIIMRSHREERVRTKHEASPNARLW